MHPLWNGIQAAFHRPDTAAYRVVQGAIWALIVISVALLAVEAVLPEGSRWWPLLRAIDRAVLWIFGAEVALRIASYRPPGLDFFRLSPGRRLRVHLLGRLRYCFQPLILIDLLTVAALVPGLRGLRLLRLLRLARTARILRYSNPFSGLAGAFRDSALLFGFALSVLGGSVLLGGVSIYLIEGGLNPTIDSVGDGVWWAMVTLTTVGFGDITPVTGLGKVVGGVLMVAGLFNLALFAGIVGRTLLTAVLGIREEQFRMSGYIDHLVICGYDPGAHMLLEALRLEFDPGASRIVFFAPGERPADLPPELLWVSGDPTKESELGKVRLTHARAAILVASRAAAPQHADAATILTAFTLRRYLARHQRSEERRQPLYVVAEILEAENVEHARTAGADEVIETTRIGFSLLAHAIAMPGTAALLTRVAASGAHSMYVGAPPEDLALPATFADAARAVKGRGALLLGLRDPDGRRDRLNPPDDDPIEPGARLIYLAERPVLGTG
jgi:voltage-gated potassium channel